MHIVGLNYIGHGQHVITLELRHTLFSNVWIITLIRHARACSDYEQVLKRDKLVAIKLIKRDYKHFRFK